MSEHDRGQLLLMGVPGKALDPATAESIRAIQPGGFIIFGRNIESPEQLRKLTDDLRDLCKVEPVVTIDQEGGRVSRLRLIGNEPPSAQQLRDSADKSAIQWHGELTGKLLRLFGFNLDLCPVLDISFDDTADNSLKGRCYGRNVKEVCKNAGVFNSALQSQGILTCGKHFPGYSRAGLDPHEELPRIPLSLAELEEHELAVFRHFARKVDSMMIGHAHYAALDPNEKSSSMSRAIIEDLLRIDIGFKGLVMTDDLDMGAILNSYGLEDAVRRCIRAGNDFAMICHRIEAVAAARQILDAMPEKDLQPALERLAGFKQRLAPPEVFSTSRFESLDAEVQELRVAVLGEEAAHEKSPEDGKRSPVEIY